MVINLAEPTEGRMHEGLYEALSLLNDMPEANFYLPVPATTDINLDKIINR